MASDDGSPSYQRRHALRHADAGNSIRVLSSSPLSKYFEISQRLLDAFQKAVDARRLDEAYVFGLRFAAFGVESLPKHQEWRRNTHAKQKRRNAQQVEKVISMMEIIKQRMDAEELVLQERRKALELDKKREEEARQKEEKFRLEQQREQDRIEQEKQRVEKSKSVEQSAMQKLLAMQNQLSKKNALSSPATSEKKEVTPTSQPVKPSQARDDKASASSSIEDSKAEKSAPDTRREEKCSMPSSTNVRTDVAPSSSQFSRQLTPRSSKEQMIIDLLQRTITNQEARLEDLQNKKIPELVRLAKKHLQEGDDGRPIALKCVAKKRALEKDLDVVKAAIFKMETQMFMLENALEDRQVQRALNEASVAMKGLQQTLGEASSADIADLTQCLPSPAHQEEDDDDLMDELQEWMEPDKAKTTSVDEDDISILTMPKIPKSDGFESRVSAKDRSETDKLLKAVLG